MSVITLTLKTSNTQCEFSGGSFFAEIIASSKCRECGCCRDLLDGGNGNQRFTSSCPTTSNEALAKIQANLAPGTSVLQIVDYSDSRCTTVSGRISYFPLNQCVPFETNNFAIFTASGNSVVQTLYVDSRCQLKISSGDGPLNTCASDGVVNVFQLYTIVQSGSIPLPPLPPSVPPTIIPAVSTTVTTISESSTLRSSSPTLSASRFSATATETATSTGSASESKSSNINIGLIVVIVCCIVALGIIGYLCMKKRRKSAKPEEHVLSDPEVVAHHIYGSQEIATDSTNDLSVTPSTPGLRHVQRLSVPQTAAGISRPLTGTENSPIASSTNNATESSSSANRIEASKTLPTDVRTWTIEQVSAWILARGAGEAAVLRFAAQKVDGRVLVNADIDELLSLIQFATLGDKISFKTALEELREFYSEPPAYD
ncbi:hypothetical protein BDR26DRAFT_919192 [Obelidium mucronatum]|nr:hypothetical protein BDR26DRAFT_919192 [Obelidium mucronatum]